MFRQEEPEINLDQILERLRSFTGRFRLGGGGSVVALLVIGILAVALVVWLATGFYTVEPGEEAALRRLGKFDPNVQGPGLHWFWPSPIGTKAILNVQEIRRLELGFRASTSVPSESLMITGDENIADVQLLVQYDITRANAETGEAAIAQFLFRVTDPDGAVLKSATETALRQVVGTRDIDEVLTTEKEAVQEDTRLLLQELLDLYQTGIRVREVKLQNVRPPVQVQDAFDDVVRAREDKQRAINLAEAFKEDIVPRARGEREKLLQDAEAFKAERINLATGQADRFLAVLVEFQKSREVTLQRLYLEAMEEILPTITKFIVASDAGGSLLQFLPLSGTAPTTFPPTSTQSPAPTQTP